MKIEVCDTCYRLGILKSALEGNFCSTHKETNAKAKAYLDFKDSLELMEDRAASLDKTIFDCLLGIKDYIDAEVKRLSV